MLTPSSQPKRHFCVALSCVMTDAMALWHAILSWNEGSFLQLMFVTNLFHRCSHIPTFLNKKSRRVKEYTQVNLGWFLISWCWWQRAAPPISGHITVFLKPHLHHLCTIGIPANHCHSLEDRKTGFSLWVWQRFVDFGQGDVWNVLSATSKQQPFARVIGDTARERGRGAGFHYRAASCRKELTKR